MDFKVLNIQTVLFLGNYSLTNKLAIANFITEFTGDLFDDDPQILPVTEDMPPEVPRIILKSKPEKGYSLNISHGRIDFFYNHQGDPNLPLEDYSKIYLEHFFKIKESFLAKYKPSIPRIACVIKVVDDLEVNANIFLKENFLQGKEFFSENYATEINSLKKKSWNSFEINRWFRIKTAKKKDSNETKAIIIEIDVNTLPEKELKNPVEYSSKDIDTFYNNIFEYFKNNIEEAFPQK